MDIQRQTGVVPEELIPPCEFPPLLSRLWSAFLRLSNRRKAGLSGPEPINYSEIKAYAELTNRKFSSWEIDAITEIDNVYLRVANG